MGIYPEKLVEAGDVEICCFDKTGTLTIPGMEFMGLYKNQEKFGTKSEINLNDQKDIALQIMGYCHNIVKKDG